MREMGNWREYQIRRLANDREAAIDYLQLTLEEYLADGDLPFFFKGLRTFIESQGGVLKFANELVLMLKHSWMPSLTRMPRYSTCSELY